MRIVPLGAGRDVGRSCLIVEFKDNTTGVVMVMMLLCRSDAGLWHAYGI